MWPQSARGRLRAALAATAGLVVLWLVWSARAALYPFIVGAILAYVLAPAVDRVERLMQFRRRRPGLAAALAVTYVYIITIGVLVVAASLMAPRIGNQAGDLAAAVPSLVEQAQEQFERSATWYRRSAPESIQRVVDQRTQELAQHAGDIAVGVVERTVAFVTGGVTIALSYIVVPFWLFYVLKDRRLGARAFYDLFPPSIRDDVRVLTQQANRVLGSYIRAQLLLAAVTGVVTGVGLTLMGIQFSLILGVIAAIANLIPVLGPIIGGIPALLVTAATRPGWMILWVFLFLFVSQNLKDYILVPRVQGQAVNLHPAVILVLLVIAGHLAGFWGLLIAVPLAAVVRDVFVYVYRRLGDEPSHESSRTASRPQLTEAAALDDSHEAASRAR
jgi:predicted PurR-regulated permease PerM